MFFESAGNGWTNQIQSLVKMFTQPQTSVIVAHLVSSLSVVIFIVYFFWKPTNKFINSQKDKLDKVHTDLSIATKETRQALTTLQQEQQNFIAERKQFLKERQEKEKQILEQRMQEAEKMKQEIIDDANKRVKLMEEEAKRTVNQHIVTLSVELAEKLIRGAINPTTQSRIIDDYLDELDTVFKGSLPADQLKQQALKKS
ncbi:ATP synthase subunit b [Mycoplasma wenyonii str. Massachusetts]|uniref:ATP synthase subunit b n=1 Tax=Mycoplasma wenyonii (strain Massachusetts) TaxID=1197325 RepID=I6Z5R4_MYCWM|nr:ATP synthase F0 subunit beta [Mycoplasma wenyonii]AFN64903.1 ATP synthase subunit b [Mycoplasma wenyonii str. Massachusetts]